MDWLKRRQVWSNGAMLAWIIAACFLSNMLVLVACDLGLIAR